MLPLSHYSNATFETGITQKKTRLDISFLSVPLQTHRKQTLGTSPYKELIHTLNRLHDTVQFILRLILKNFF